MSIARPSSRRSSGVVLVIVLVGLALMMVLLLALFEGTLKQSQGAVNDVLLNREKMLADSAVALVIGQIAQASTQTGQTWISQPGLLRTYAPTATRTPTACYKLYSTPNLTGMIDTSGSLGFMATDVPSNWSTLPAQYTDLNASAQTAGLFGQTLYPILDPGAVGTVPGVGTDSGTVQMPVAWLYQLQDGTLGPASNGTAANPIIARIAFWTDDETSKININTAGCGTPWNTPRVSSPDDLAWRTHQPAAGEYSAYPGHPATTSLGLVFGSGTLSPQQLLGITPRYAWGGSQFGSQPTTPGESVTPKMDRLYASVDELTFSSSLANSVRVANPVTTSQLNTARFFLTAHSNAPETTLLGEPRVAIWPVSDGASATAPGITATDRAIMSAATIGTAPATVRNYYFQRNSPLNPLDDFDPNAASPSAATASNVQLFNELVNRGSVNLPGCGTTFASKYPGANWTQLMLEITDFIHATNAVDPTPTPFVPFAPANSSGVGCGFVEPLTTTSGSGSSKVTLRGIGRCPTLSSLTLVFYVCGFRFKTTTPPTPDIDYDANPDTPDGADWKNHFAMGAPNSLWAKVSSELVRAFVVPCTYQPGCGFPEVSDACDIQISGLENVQLKAVVSGKLSNFSFPTAATAISPLLGQALAVLPADRSWGGNEGPAAWRAAANNIGSSTWPGYPFASTQPFAVPILSGPPGYLPSAWATPLSLSTTNLTVNICDSNGATMQTLNLTFPSVTITHAPTVNGECDYSANPALPGSHVLPSYYMNLGNRLRATQAGDRAALIQWGDVSRSIEANTDLRILAGLANVPSGLFSPLKTYKTAVPNAQGGSHSHDIRFADGTSACFAPFDPSGSSADDNTSPNGIAKYPKTITPLVTATDWQSGASIPYYQFTSPAGGVPTGSNGVNLASGNPGDWDTGPGFASDGAQINLPDSGSSLNPGVAYQSLAGGQVGAPTQRTPNALLPSPVVFGSLPAGIAPTDSLLAATNPTGTPSSQPWRTLLFCPYPAASTVLSNPAAAPYSPLDHPGAASPPDHLILDNFWMPVIEPYAISTCMATAGKVNLNDQIAPFTYLHRSTALRALLDDLRIPAIPVAWANAYKSSGLSTSIWNKVDADATVAQIEYRFTANTADAYLSESEICTIPLVPLLNPPLTNDPTNVAATQAALGSFWDGTSASSAGGLTGDNLRELPYAQLYGRLTTRSNSYTVHVRVQVLKKLTSDSRQGVWNEGTDVVLGDWRGSYEIERYLDPSASAPAAGKSLASSYKYRIVSARAFAP